MQYKAGKSMRRHNHLTTKFIQLNSNNCQACWECLSICPNEVIGKIDIFFHKHAKISEPDKCICCMKSEKVCEYQAIRSADKI